MLKSFLIVFGLMVGANDPVVYQAYQTKEALNLYSVSSVTAYTDVETCQDSQCIMASGKRAYKGSVACPRAIPLGTKVYIQPFGLLACEDRTALSVDGRFDVFFGYGEEAHSQALKFGIQKKEIYK